MNPFRFTYSSARLWVLLCGCGLVLLQSSLVSRPVTVAASGGKQEEARQFSPAAGCVGANYTPAVGSPVAVGDFPVAVAAADFNQDSKVDLVAVNRNADTITILQGNGSGGFAPTPASPIAVGDNPFSVTVADFDLNGTADLAIPNELNGNVTVLLGLGNGNFGMAPGAPFATVSHPRNLAASDFNLDGKPDLIVASIGGAANATVFLGNGNGSFTQNGLPFLNGQPSDVVVADFNLDGRPDLGLVVMLPRSVTAFLGNGSGGFSAAGTVSFSSTIALGGLATGDVNRDGKPDLVVAQSNTNGNGAVNIMLGNGAGGFSLTPGSPVAAGGLTRDVGLLDFNLDGLVDLAAVNGGNASLLQGDGTGAFTPAIGSPVAAGGNAQTIATADFNQDGKVDYVIANGTDDTLSVLLNTCPAQCPGSLVPVAGSPFAVGNSPSQVAQADFNLDGKADLAVTNSGANTVSIMAGDGTGALTPAPGAPISVGTLPSGIVAGDWNKDGKPDLAVTNQNSASLSILLGNGSFGFTLAGGAPMAVGGSPNFVTKADVNADGKADLLVSNTSPNRVTVLLGNGNGGFTPSSGPMVGVGINPIDIEVADFNQDGKLDLATANFLSDNVSILLGDGTGGFSGNSPFTGLDGVNQLAVADFNRDGKVDLAMGMLLAGRLLVRYGNGNGTFGGGGVFFLSPIGGLASDDLNQDGKADLVVALVGGRLDLFMGDGNGGFSSITTQLGGRYGTNNRGVLVDLNKDNQPDFAFTNQGTPGSVIVLLNGC